MTASPRVRVHDAQVRIRHARCTATIALAAATVAIAPASVRAQVVRGTVLTTDSAATVAGAVVVLRDSDGNPVARTFSSSTGEFTLTAPRGGAFDLRIFRIGFHPSSVAPFALRAGETHMVKALLNGGPVNLAALAVVASVECAVRPDSSQAAFTVWEEARKALVASMLARLSPPIVRFRHFDRMLDSRGTSVLSETQRVERGASDRPFISAPADTLVRRGFVRLDSGGATYDAPDAEVLLSDVFADTHCMRLEPLVAADSQRIGVRFAPIRSREDLVDITGVLWLDRRSAELQLLEYTYTGLPRAFDAAHAGGKVEFVRLPTGPWIVSGWEIRMPQMEIVQRGEMRRGTLTALPEFGRRAIEQVSGVHVVGGEVVDVAVDGMPIWAPRTSSATLRFVDATTRQPVRSVSGTVGGVNTHFLSDSMGALTLSGLQPGEYALQLRTPFGDSLALAPRAVRVLLSNTSAAVILPMPSRESMLAMACGTDPGKRGLAIIVGTVVDSAGAPVPSAIVYSLWMAGPGANGVLPNVGTEPHTFTADTMGRFRMCDAPRGVPIRFYAGRDDARSTRPTIVSVSAREPIVALTLHLGDGGR